MDGKKLRTVEMSRQIKKQQELSWKRLIQEWKFPQETTQMWEASCIQIVRGDTAVSLSDSSRMVSAALQAGAYPCKISDLPVTSFWGFMNVMTAQGDGSGMKESSSA